MSGRATLHAFTIDRVGIDPGQRSQLPLIISIVELEEGPRMTSRLVECKPSDVEIGMPLEVCFEPLESETLIHFRPSATR